MRVAKLRKHLAGIADLLTELEDEIPVQLDMEDRDTLQVEICSLEEAWASFKGKVEES